MRKTGSNSKKQLNTQRIRFEKQGELLVSRLLYSDGRHMVRLILNPDNITFFIIDAVTGHVFVSGGDGINNFEVLQRNAKKSLEKFLDSNFIIEKKKTK